MMILNDFHGYFFGSRDLSFLIGLCILTQNMRLTVQENFVDRKKEKQFETTRLVVMCR